MKNFNEFLFIYWSENGGGGALVHVCVLAHIVSLNYRIAWWIFTKLGRDKVLHDLAHLYWLLGQTRQGGGSRAGPKQVPGGSLLQRTSSSDRKATATNRMHSSDLEAFEKKYCCHWEVKFFETLRTSFWT